MIRSHRFGAIVVVLILLLAPLHSGANDISKYKGRSLVDILRSLQAGGIQILFSSELVLPEMIVHREPNSKSQVEALQEMLAEFGLGLRNDPSGLLIIVKLEQFYGSIKGTVRNGNDETPVASAKVEVYSSPSRFVTTDNHGEFIVEKLLPGQIEVEVRKEGYAVAQVPDVNVSSGQLTPMTIDLIPIKVDLKEIVVSPAKFSMLGEESTSEFLDRNEVQRLPHLGDDLFRAIGRLPGTTGGDISAQFYVRGGAHDEELIVFDGLPLQQSFHLADFLNIFSIIDSEAVQDVQIYTGGFSVEYENKMSGVIDITSRRAPDKTLTSLGVSFITARFLNTGSFDSEKGEWLVSARRGYLDLVLPLVDPSSNFDPTYYDLFAKVQHQLGSNSVFSLHFLGSGQSAFS